MQYITGVALGGAKDNVIFISLPKPFRHGHLYIALNAANKELPNVDKFDSTKDFHRYRQGFITDDGQFLNRIEAKILASKNGQLNIYDGKNNPNGYDNRHFEQLFSEDLW